MTRLLALALVAIAVAPCSGRMFKNLGNDTGVPPESIDQYAAEHNISRDEARAR